MFITVTHCTTTSHRVKIVRVRTIYMLCPGLRSPEPEYRSWTFFLESEFRLKKTEGTGAEFKI